MLADIGSPADVRRIALDHMPVLCRQIREFLVARVCATGGHLGVNLGAVELTVALHRVFESPRDPFLFDIGHQAYVHKILTGRVERFDSLRARGGLSGYASRCESPHDWVENSHASTALSYADGLANAFAGSDRTVVAIIGDGALTGGLAWEGLNNLAAKPHRPIVVVLNDNGRSYDSTIGGIAKHLKDLRSGWASRSVFEQLGLAYIGPVDGHDVSALEDAFRRARSLARTTVVHAVTEKGRGYGPAEADQADHMHAIGVLDPNTGEPLAPHNRSWTSVFESEICRQATIHEDLICVSAAMLQPVGFRRLAQTHPRRVLDVGIAEQHAVCSAAGLAMGGLHPVVAVYSTFLNRAFDQVLLDVGLHGLPVTFVLDRAGITGPDGPSHHGIWDTGLLTLVPGMRIAAPRDPARLCELLDEAIDCTGPTAIRLPKASAGTDIPQRSRTDGLDILYRSRSRPLELLIVCAGVTAEQSLYAAAIVEAAGYGVTVVDPRWIYPINPTLVHFAARHRVTVTVEDSCVVGGFGANLLLSAASATVLIRPIGVAREYVGHGDRSELLVESGVTSDNIAKVALEALTEEAAPASATGGADECARS
ncbi:1-deoxy-D-xylulose-5-phosphate synthase [Nocardia brasiliensis]